MVGYFSYSSLPFYSLTIGCSFPSIANVTTATVRETLRFSAHLRQPRDMPVNKKDAVSFFLPIYIIDQY